MRHGGPTTPAEPAPSRAPLTSPRSRSLSFDRTAARYAAATRPPSSPRSKSSPAAPLCGARTLDVGAGTGISTRLVYARGAHVTAVEPGPGMAAELHRALPHMPIVRGDGNRLPFATASADLITYAQSWHWTDQTRAASEALRVLRPGGALALWWNVSDHAVPWIAGQDARLRRFFGADDSAHGSSPRQSLPPPRHDGLPATLTPQRHHGPHRNERARPAPTTPRCPEPCAPPRCLDEGTG